MTKETGEHARPEPSLRRQLVIVNNIAELATHNPELFGVENRRPERYTVGVKFGEGTVRIKGLNRPNSALGGIAEERIISFDLPDFVNYPYAVAVRRRENVDPDTLPLLRGRKYFQNAGGVYILDEQSYQEGTIAETYLEALLAGKSHAKPTRSTFGTLATQPEDVRRNFIGMLDFAAQVELPSA